ncbi:MAG: SURF1 family protein [Immundisolibacteraceae bacterium]|nr:SURF1 family protein [Immundisolibacteraceae bacterium]
MALFGTGYQLKITWRAVLVLLICLPILLRLGFWQLERAEYKTQLLGDLQQAQLITPRSIETLAELKALPEYTRVRLQGEYLVDRTSLLDNRYHDGRVGFNAVSMFRLSGSAEVLLLNRGWVALGQTRYPLPDLPPLAGLVEVVGQVRAVPTDTIVLKEDQFQQWPQLVQNIDIDKLNSVIAEQLPTFWVLLAADQVSTLKRDWPVVIVGPERHYGYAVQWFGMAIAFLAVMIMASRTKIGEISSE